jgi:small GTP-binding protein
MLSPSLKIVFLGSSMSGKTTLFHRLSSRQFRTNLGTTIAPDTLCRSFTLDLNQIPVFFEDTPGQDIYRSIAFQCSRKANCVAVVYSVLDRETFETMREIVNQLRDEIREVFIVLIAAKCNSAARVITRKEGEEIARSFGVLYFEMSAETGEGVEDGFLGIVAEVVKRSCACDEKGEEREEAIKSEESECVRMCWRYFGAFVVIGVYCLLVFGWSVFGSD